MTGGFGIGTQIMTGEQAEKYRRIQEMGSSARRNAGVLQSAADQLPDGG